MRDIPDFQTKRFRLKMRDTKSFAHRNRANS